MKIKQRDISDCGAACLASIAGHYGSQIPVSKIRQLSSTDQKGTNLLGLIEASAKLGFSAKGVRGDFSSLFKIPKPAIAHVILKNSLHHYVVIYKVTNRYIEVMDPADGKYVRHTHDRFKSIWSGVLLLLLPEADFQTQKESVSVLSRFYKLIEPHRFILFQSFVGAIVYTILGLSTSIFIQKIVDNVLVDGNHNLLNLLSLVMLFILVFQLIIGVLKSVFTIKTGQKIDSRLILGYYKYLLTLPQHFFDTMRVGEIISRIGDAAKIRTFINDVAINLVVDVFVVVFAFALMFTYYWKLAVIILLIIPIYLVIYLITNWLNKKVERRLMEEAADLESQLVESITSVRTIKEFCVEDYANIKTETRFITLLKTVYTSSMNSIFTGTSSELFTRAFTIVLLWIGAGYVLGNQITPGELMSFYALIGYFTGPVAGLIGANKTIQNALIAADRLFEIMDLEREKDGNQLKLEAHMIGDIQFKEVSFRYGSRATIFENLTLTIPKGSITAIVGESGSGKSTLAAVLQKLYPISGGQVFIGDYDINYLENRSLRKLVGVVPQKVDLFAGNVIENIALGDYHPDMKKIIEICQRMGIMEFIEELPAGFETYLGENGATLSGGQKQRLAIARALYRDPEVLILDEATASIDSKAEHHVQQMIQALKKEGKTIITISHRLSSITMADKILLIDKGKIVGEGSHTHLLESSDAYHSFWNGQMNHHLENSNHLS